MFKAIIRNILIAAVLLTSSNLIKAQDISTYCLTARNFYLIAPDSLTFDIHLLHTNYPTPFEYAGGQYFLNFNNNFGNGGTLSLRILDTEMPDCPPRNPSVVPGVLRLANNAFPGPGMGCEVSHIGNGTLLCKVSLRTTTSFLPLDSFHIRWRNIGIPITKLFAYVNGINTEITDSNFHFIEFPVTAIEPNVSFIPNDYFLAQNYPNPFNPTTKLEFGIPESGFVSLKVYDLLGNEVAMLVNEKKGAGNYEIKFDGIYLSSGIYYYRMIVSSNNGTAKFSDSKPMVLLK